MKKHGLVATSIPMKEVIDSGFDFNIYEYTANLTYQEGSQFITLLNCFILGDNAICINKDKTFVLLIRLSKNPNMKIEKIDRTKIN